MPSDTSAKKKPTAHFAKKKRASRFGVASRSGTAAYRTPVSGQVDPHEKSLGKAIDPLREAVKVLRFPVGKRSPADAIIDWVRGSPDVRVVNEISAYAQIDVEKLLPALGFSSRTLARKREKGQPLDPNQADRAARLARIIGLAESVLGSKEAAGRWLQKENRVLGRTPLSILDTDVGAERVEEILMRLEYGVYS